MPPEKQAEVQAWMIKAARDLEAAARLMATDKPLCDIVVYHCQQAAEKALKGYLTWNDRPFGKTHALTPLLGQAIAIDNAFDQLIDHAEELSPFAWRFRYPGDLLEPDIEETERAVALARKIVDFVVEHLPRF